MDLREAWSNLNERERRLLTLLGVVVLLLVIVIPMYSVASALSEVEDKNKALSVAIARLERARPRMLEIQSEKRALDELYDRPVPALSTFLEETAEKHALQLKQSDQPEIEVGDGDFRRSGVRATIQEVELAPVLQMISAIINSSHPVAIDRMEFQRVRDETKGYNVEIGVVAYERANTPQNELDEDDDEDE